MAQTSGVRLPHAASAKRSDRMLAVLKTLHSRGAVAIADLVTELGVSAPTLRRDLADMADQRLLIRTRGGARALPARAEVPVHLRDSEAAEAKRRIALRAAELIPKGPMTVALTGGTTTAEIARALSRRPRLTIITNALSIALELAAYPATKVILTGGILRPVSLEAVGVLAENTFTAVEVRIAVLGADGMSATRGATTHDEVEARTNHAMAGSAQRVIVVADGSKIGRVTPAQMAPTAQIDVLVTDTSADPIELDRIRDAGVTVHVVEPKR
ncbi:MAG: DeoR/GlpR transcriptional regulator [Acidobacteria bacterium]|nr:DeoR/GlpR transcriptional regulator [Acidobacteriota bacterium]